MSLVYKLNGSTLPTSRVFYNFQGAEDWEMSQDATGPGGGQGTVTIQDPSGDLTVRTWMPFTVEESASSQPRLVTSWITKVTERRGSYMTGVGRDFVCELADPNVLLGLRLINSSDGNRPSETVAARLAWLIGSDCLDGIVFDTGYMTGNALVFDAADYRGKYATDVLADVASRGGRIYFAFWDPTASKVGLFFDVPDTTISTSTISVSNVAADVNNSTVFALSDDATWERDGVGVYSTIRYEYAGGNLTVHNSATASRFFPSPLLDRGEVIETLTVGKASTAASHANLALTQASDEDKTLKGRIWLPKEQAGLFYAGQRASFRASHFTGLTSATYLHLDRVTYKPWADHPGYYEVNFEASNFGITGSGSSPGSTTPFPTQPPGAPVHFWEFSYTLIGDELVYPASGINGHSTTTAAFVADAGITYTYHITVTTGDTYSPRVILTLGATQFIVVDASLTQFQFTTDVYDGTFTDHLMTTGDWYATGFVADSDHSHTHTATVAGWIDPDGWDDGTTVSVPVAGSPVLGEVVATGDGSTTSFTTDWTFAAGSLKVYVDLLDQTGALTASDGTAKTFTLGFAPALGEQVTGDYIKAP